MLMRLLVVLLFAAFSQLLLAAPSTVDESVPIELSQYQDFLLNPLRSDRESVVVIMDPYCPYCRKAVPKMKWLSNYNTYLLWSPVLGKRSEKRVKEIMRCKQLNSPVVFDAIQKIKAPECEAEKQAGSQSQARRFELIKAALKHFNPPAVPSFFYRDKPSSFSWLVKNRIFNRPVQKAPASKSDGSPVDQTGFSARPAIPLLSVDWARYTRFEVKSSGSARQPTKTVAIVLDPQAKDSMRALNSIQEWKGDYRFYVFWASQIKHQVVPQMPCSDAVQSVANVTKTLCQSKTAHTATRNAEFLLLANVEKLPAVYVDGYPSTLALLQKTGSESNKR